MWVYYSIKHSVMLFFTSEIFQQNVLQESLDTINRSCMKDHETFRLAQHAPAIQADVRALGAQIALTQIIDKKGFDLIKKCVDSILQAPHRKELEDELLRYQKRSTEVDARTAELYSNQGNTDITELELIDETTQCEKCEVHHAKRKVLLHT